MHEIDECKDESKEKRENKGRWSEEGFSPLKQQNSCARLV